MDVVLEMHHAGRDSWSRAPFDYDDLLTCPICHEPYFSGRVNASPSAPHSTCSQGHMCCSGCFDRLGSGRFVSCPTCRGVSASLALGVVREAEGLYSAFFTRGRLRWACAGVGCAFACATLMRACAHAGTCECVERPCPVCGLTVARGELAGHAACAHAEETAVVGGLVSEKTRLLVLPLGYVLDVTHGAGGLAVSVVCVGIETRGAAIELGFAVPCGATAVVDVSTLVATGARSPHVRVAYPARLTCERLVALYTLPTNALVRVAGALVVVVGGDSDDLKSEITVLPLRGARYPQKLPLLTRVSVQPPNSGGACWARMPEGHVEIGTLERVDAERAYVRLPTGLISVPKEQCGARYGRGYRGYASRGGV